MKVAGFTIVRNAVKFDYPIVEAITSILPVCDEFVVAVGASEDETLALIQSIDSPKIRILETVWDESLREGGRVLADETNKALSAVSKDVDWAFYIQGDEVVHEQYLPAIRQAMEQWESDKRVEGLLFDYSHFYGSYDFIGDSRRWYRREVRVVRPHQGIYSFRDAQGFQKNNRPLKVKHTGAGVYHYGWVKHPEKQQAKQLSFNKLWHSDDWVERNVEQVDHFDYGNIDALRRFKGDHPQVMQKRINRMNWSFSFDPAQRKLSTKNKVLGWVESLTGWRVGEYKNYRLIK